MSQFTADTFEVCVFDAATGSFSEPERWIMNRAYPWNATGSNEQVAQRIASDFAGEKVLLTDFHNEHSTVTYKLRIQPWGQNQPERAERVIIDVRLNFIADPRPFVEADWSKR
ncbi:hypothetical protein MF271_19075 (plasmid) [Deinococcus sp. KNUC1210]|uniref:hypothetical protein n=1 Tax=Deinococcus sp. KNUC1210 TaxID=2917691 RepID=UPI001EF1301D|nr:hypothetical protein [Deinococcus sp. KNUC1210]ULH17424.1 hypothetical protein MF271_19075 [Deinococcus sp. KNUC1210]